MRGLLGLFSAAGWLWAQGLAGTCSCGSTPMPPLKNRRLHPYANAPEDMRPYSRFGAPYHEYYGDLVV